MMKKSLVNHSMQLKFISFSDNRHSISRSLVIRCSHGGSLMGGCSLGSIIQSSSTFSRGLHGRKIPQCTRKAEPSIFFVSVSSWSTTLWFWSI